MRTTLFAALAGLVVGGGTVPAQTIPAAPKAADPPAAARQVDPNFVKPAEPAMGRSSDMPPPLGKPSPLEEMLTKALKLNPELQVAEASIAEAEAKLRAAQAVRHQVRLQVAESVIKNFHQLEEARKNVELKEQELKQTEARVKAGAQGPETATKAQSALVQARAEMARVEATTNFLLGKPVTLATATFAGQTGPGGASQMTAGPPGGGIGGPPGGMPGMAGSGMAPPGVGPPGMAGRMGPMAGMMPGMMGTGGGGMGGPMGGGMGPGMGMGGMGGPAGEESPAYEWPRPEALEAVRKALDRDVELSVAEVTLAQVLNELEGLIQKEPAARINVVKKLDAEGVKNHAPVTLQFKGKLADLLQMVQDASELRFYVRDYGLMIANQEVPNFVPLTELGKRGLKGMPSGGQGINRPPQG